MVSPTESLHASPHALKRFHEYYHIKESIPISLQPISQDSLPQNEQDFEAQIPEIFKLASQLQDLDFQATQALRHLGPIADVIETIVHQQNQKLNILLSYLLRQEASDEHELSCYSYGGGGVEILHTDLALRVGDWVQLKLFLTDSGVVLYTYAEVAAVEFYNEKEQKDTYKYTLAFHYIRDDDRELLVRSSLHAQTKLLKKRARDKNT